MKKSSSYSSYYHSDIDDDTLDIDGNIICPTLRWFAIKNIVDNWKSDSVYNFINCMYEYIFLIFL